MVVPPGVQITGTVPASKAGWLPVGFNSLFLAARLRNFNEMLKC